MLLGCFPNGRIDPSDIQLTRLQIKGGIFHTELSPKNQNGHNAITDITAKTQIITINRQLKAIYCVKEFA